MKVSDVMQRSVIKVGPQDPLKDVARLIFSLGISGVPVVENYLLIGIVTEEDIFKKIHPTLSDVSDDYVHSKNFELMEHEISSILETPISRVMNKKVTTVTSDTPLMKAQTMMLLNHFSRLPVINSKNELVGIISQGDIFREIIKNEIPQIEKARYADFISQHYDNMVNWENRLQNEIPALFNEFRKLKAESVLDLGTWTGEYPVALAKEGINKVTGLDHNPLMIKASLAKLKKLPKDKAEHLNFILTDFTDINEKVKETYDVAICLGNALPYIPIHAKELFANVGKVLRKKNSAIVLQLLNIDKIINKHERLLSFSIQKSQSDHAKEHMYIEFFDQSNQNGKLLHHVVVFDNDGTNWIFKGITTVPIFHYTKNDIEKALKGANFSKIIIAGNTGAFPGEYGHLSFSTPFESSTSDWLNIVAIR